MHRRKVSEKCVHSRRELFSLSQFKCFVKKKNTSLGMTKNTTLLRYIKTITDVKRDRERKHFNNRVFVLLHRYWQHHIAYSCCSSWKGCNYDIIFLRVQMMQKTTRKEECIPGSLITRISSEKNVWNSVKPINSPLYLAWAGLAGSETTADGELEQNSPTTRCRRPDERDSTTSAAN